MKKSLSEYKMWEFHNTILLLLSLIVFFFLSGTPWMKSFITHIGNFGYIGSFIAGIFFVSTFTIAPAGVVLFHLATAYSPIGIALAAGIGAVIGDLLIFRFFKDYVFDELRPLFRRFGEHPFMNVFRTPYFAWMLPLLGMVIIASPFPDEIGIGMLGISKMKNWQFATLAFFLNSLGILLIVTLAKSL